MLLIICSHPFIWGFGAGFLYLLMALYWSLAGLVFFVGFSPCAGFTCSYCRYLAVDLGVSFHIRDNTKYCIRFYFRQSYKTFCLNLEYKQLSFGFVEVPLLGCFSVGRIHFYSFCVKSNWKPFNVKQLEPFYSFILTVWFLILLMVEQLQWFLSFGLKKEEECQSWWDWLIVSHFDPIQKEV